MSFSGIFKKIYINLLMFFTRCCHVFQRKNLKSMGDEIHNGVSPELANKIFEQVSVGGDIFAFAGKETPKNQDIAPYTTILKGK